jgi:hypothetical protein
VGQRLGGDRLPRCPLTAPCSEQRLGGDLCATDRWGGTPMKEGVENRHDAIIAYLRAQVMMP